MSDWRDRLNELIGQLREVEVEPDGSFGHGATVDEDLTALISIAESAARRLSEIAKDGITMLRAGVPGEAVPVEASEIVYDSRWGEVARLRREAGDCVTKGDALAAAMLDNQASTLAEKLRAEPEQPEDA